MRKLVNVLDGQIRGARSMEAEQYSPQPRGTIKCIGGVADGTWQPWDGPSQRTFYINTPRNLGSMADFDPNDPGDAMGVVTVDRTLYVAHYLVLQGHRVAFAAPIGVEEYDALKPIFGGTV